MAEEQLRDVLAEYQRAGSAVSPNNAVSQLNFFSVAAFPRFGQASTVPLQTEEHTLGAKAFGKVVEAVAPSRSDEQRAGRVARHEFAAEVVADTFAMLPGVKWGVAGTFRALFLSSDEKGLTGVGLDFLQGAALNKVSRLAMPNSRMTKLFEGVENKVAREVLTHATVGVGFGVVSTGFRPEAWHDKSGEFSLGTGLKNVGTAGLLGGFINVPAGAIGSRIGKVTLQGSLAQKFGVNDAVFFSNVTAGTTGGIIFGGTDALMNGRNVLEGMFTGGFVGGLTGTAVGFASSRPHIAAEFKLGGNKVELTPERRLAVADEMPGVTPGEKPIIDKVARSKALELGIDPEVYARLQLDMKSRAMPLEQRIAALGKPEAVTLVERAQKPGADVSTTKDYKTFGDWAKDWMLQNNTPARRYRFGPNEVILSENYAKGLDEVLALRLITEQDPNTLQAFPEKLAEFHAAEKTLKEHPLRDRAHPVDLIPFLEEVPDRTLVKRLILSEERNPDDPWHQKTYKPDFVSAASAAEDGTMTYYAQNRDFFSRETAYHEWSHLLENKVAVESGANAHAFEHEKAWGPSDYSWRDPGEMFAEMGAAMLHPEAAQFLVAVHQAPIKASIYSSAMGKALNSVPEQYRSVFAEQYAARIGYVENNILPFARENLLTSFQTGGRQEAARAAQILGTLGAREHYLALKAGALKGNESSVSKAAYEAALGYVQRGKRGLSQYELLYPTSTADTQATFLAEMAEHGSHSRLRATESLRELAKTNPRAKLFHELFTMGNRTTVGGVEQAHALRIVNEIPDTHGKQMAFKEALRFANGNPDTRVDIAMAAMEKNVALHLDGLKVIADTGQSRSRPILEAFAKGHDALAREVARQGLVKVEKTEVWEQAMAGLSSPESTERQVSIFELGKMRDNRAIKPLLEMYLNGTTGTEQRMAADMLETYYTQAVWKYQAKEMASRQQIYGAKLRGLMQGHPVYEGN